MKRRIRLLPVVGLSILSALLLGQACGTPNPVPDAGNDDDALAPLVPDNGPDPLAPLMPRGICAVWSGEFTAARHTLETLNASCPPDITMAKPDEEWIDAKFNVLFDNMWSADNFGSSCFRPTGGDAEVADGTVKYRRVWGDNYDMAFCNKYTHDSGEDNYTFSVNGKDVNLEIEIDAATYTEGQDILAERPCRTDYPVLVKIFVRDPMNGTGTSTSHHVGNDDCWPGPATVTDENDPVTSNSAASFMAVLHGTYHIAADGNDTLEASLDISPTAVPGCPGINDQCNCQDSLQVSEKYTLTLSRFPEGDRDLDGMCDSIDGCPDNAWDFAPPCGE